MENNIEIKDALVKLKNALSLAVPVILLRMAILLLFFPETGILKLLFAATTVALAGNLLKTGIYKLFKIPKE